MAPLSPTELRQIRIDAGLSVPEAAKAVGVVRSTWWRWEEKGVPVPDEKVRAIRDLLHSDGTGPAHQTDDEMHILVYNQKAAGGCSMDPATAEFATGRITLQKDFVHHRLGVAQDCLYALTVEGDSMEPTIRGGEMVLVAPQDGGTIQDGVYVLRVDGAILCKRLGRLPGNVLAVTSDNPAGPSYQINLGELGCDFAILGRVVAVLRRV